MYKTLKSEISEFLTPINLYPDIFKSYTVYLKNERALASS